MKRVVLDWFDSSYRATWVMLLPPYFHSSNLRNLWDKFIEVESLREKARLEGWTNVFEKMQLFEAWRKKTILTAEIPV